MTLEGVIKTVKKAEAIVINAETKFIKELFEDINTARHEGRDGEVDLMTNELIKEGKRVHKKPEEVYDEEEAIIARLVKKK